MAWFFGKKDKVVKTEGLWVKCEACREIVYRADVEKVAHTCPKCGNPFRLSARERLDLLLDPGSFEERDAGLRSTDPLGFKDNRGRYADRLRSVRDKLGREDAVVSGLGRIGGHPVAVAVFEFAFMGGSMASVAGEKITRTIELAARKRTPLLIVTCSGGARMQEGVLSLMQMAKTSAALHRLAEERVRDSRRAPGPHRVRRAARHPGDDPPAAAGRVPAIGVPPPARHAGHGGGAQGSA
jgi:acetyl-CoA carboxylase carboxyl transferase subunit beta